jgi:hypothetical protein
VLVLVTYSVGDQRVTAEGKINPDEPNHLNGTLTDTRTAESRTVITWDLTQD